MGFLNDATAADSSNDEPVTGGEGGETVDTLAPANDNAISTKPEGAPVKLSRREAAKQRDELATKLDALTKTFGDAQKSWETKLSQVEQESARHRGAFETLIAQTRQQQIQQGAPAPRKSPDEMKRAAREALDAGKFDDWDKLNTEAILEQVKGMIPAQQSGYSGPHPVVQAMMAQFPAVLNAGQRGIDMAIAQDNVLAAMGVPDGPERYRKAFELASNTLGGQAPQQPQFSQTSRGALSGVSGARNSGPTNGGEPGITLSAYERDVARRCGMSLEEYAGFLAEGNPDRVKNA